MFNLFFGVSVVVVVIVCAHEIVTQYIRNHSLRKLDSTLDALATKSAELDRVAEVQDAVEVVQKKARNVRKKVKNSETQTTSKEK